MPCLFWTVIFCLVGAGAIGGLVGFYLSPATTTPTPALAWWKQCLIGIAASLMIPVFLRIGSELIAGILETSTCDGVRGEVIEKLLVLIGFCLMASISSQRFINTITDRALQDISKKADTALADAKKAVAISEENIVEPDPQTRVTDAAAPTPNVSANAAKVRASMRRSNFKYRTAGGIALEEQMSRADVVDALHELREKDLVKQERRSQGLRWVVLERLENDIQD